MNQDGIEHVSYTIMDLRVSPKSGKYLLAATDKDRHFIFPVCWSCAHEFSIPSHTTTNVSLNGMAPD